MPSDNLLDALTVYKEAVKHLEAAMAPLEEGKVLSQTEAARLSALIDQVRAAGTSFTLALRNEP